VTCGKFFFFLPKFADVNIIFKNRFEKIFFVPPKLSFVLPNKNITEDRGEHRGPESVRAAGTV
jgi:hypothetical protein